MGRYPRYEFQTFCLAMTMAGLLGQPCNADEPPIPGSAAGDPQPGAREYRRPNILLIFTDDESYKTVGCYPEALPGVKTPHIDALAAEGIRFHGAYNGAWCMP